VCVGFFFKTTFKSDKILCQEHALYFVLISFEYKHQARIMCSPSTEQKRDRECERERVTKRVIERLWLLQENIIVSVARPLPSKAECPREIRLRFAVD
jgi:hypothetical protein